MRYRLLLIDVAVVIAFVLAGRSSHEEALSPSEVGRTAAPFLVALAVGWAATRAWRDPVAAATGAGVFATTLAGGMLLRRVVFGDGTAWTFVVVAGVFLGLGLVGWRLAAGRMTRRSVAAGR
jgi:hypothetical protein